MSLVTDDLPAVLAIHADDLAAVVRRAPLHVHAERFHAKFGLDRLALAQRPLHLLLLVETAVKSLILSQAALLS